MKENLRCHFLLVPVLVALTSCPLFADSERLTDGIIQFAIATVNGVSVFSNQEKQNVIDGIEAYGKVAVIQAVTAPSNFEVSVATSGIKFDNYTDYRRCVDEKEYLQDKIDDLKQSEIRKMKPTIDYLQAEIVKR